MDKHDEERSIFMKSRETAHVNLAFLLTAIVYLSVSFCIELWSLATKSELPFPALIIISQLGLFAVPFLYAVKRGNIGENLGFHKISVGTGILVVLLMICLEPVLTLINALSQCFVDAPTTEMITENAKIYPFPVMFLLVAIMPAICEEIIYRGVFFQTYRKEAVIPGALLSAFLFGVLHGNLNQFAYTFFMGFIIALTVYVTKSILAGMLMHLTVNGLSTILLYVMQKSQSLQEQVAEVQETTEQFTVVGVISDYGFMAFFGGLLAYILFQAIARKCGTWRELGEAFRAEGKAKAFFGMFTWPLIAAVAVMIGLMVLSELAK